MSSDPGHRSPISVRPSDPGAWDAWNAVLAHAFGEEEPPERAAFLESVREPERCVSAYLGADLVGVAAAFSFTMTVPGGAALPVAGVTAVGVMPTARRRGTLRAMMRHQLDGLHEGDGEFLAALTASQPDIYGRFGYGLATWRMSLRTPSGPGRLSTAGLPVDAVRIRLADPAEALPDCLKVYEELMPVRPGVMLRSGGWEKRHLVAPLGEHASPLRCVLAETDGQIRGYAYYAVAPHWDQGGANGTTVVREVFATDPVVRVALWRYLFELDLMTSLQVDNLPVDDPLLYRLADPRAAKPSVMDGLFVRLVDVGRALAARTYSAPVDVVLDVADEFCPWNAGRWRLVGDEHGARCERTSDAADLALGVRGLGSLYLGGVSAAALAQAGRITETRRGALAHVNRAFAHDPKPLMAFGF
ncbi:GNAT family N-acetyltransferase [Yinghuangia seranimata]|uniref:GNAT family N-acetyltransferase n=1 Tax=Yinghuangia seranimata TaxID=408067 RepID=UPI00248C10F0|nr:GNAT family N-acetyltransferase [Yinghuangia seranimata]MDI2127359.1 GNAT family N-acetyltransferase [Yinghuangia seranimata]